MNVALLKRQWAPPTSGRDSPCLEEKLAFLVEVEDTVSSGKSHFLAGVLKKLFCLVKCL